MHFNEDRTRTDEEPFSGASSSTLHGIETDATNISIIDDGT